MSQRPPHICHLTPELPPGKHGGIGTHTLELVSGLGSQGWPVTVILLKSEGRSPGVSIGKTFCHEAGFPVIEVITGWRRLLGWRLGQLWLRLELVRRIDALIRTCQFDVLNGYEDGGWFPLKRPLAPVVVQVHGGENFFHFVSQGRLSDRFLHALQRRTLFKAAAVVANSHFTAGVIEKMYGIPANRLDVIYNGVDTDLFCPDPSVPEDEGLIAFHNSIEARKGVGELLEAFRIVAEQLPQARLMLAGHAGMENGRSRADLYAESLPPEIRSRVTFLGQQDRATGIVPLLRRAAICCYPSRSETFGLAPVEAMAVGKPVILFRNGPGRELIEDGLSGMHCNPQDIGSLAKAMCRLLTDREQRRAIGAKARDRAVATFSKAAFVQGNMQVLHRIAKC